MAKPRIEQQPIDIPFTGGIDQSVPEKLLPSDRLAYVEGGDLNVRGAITKLRSFGTQLSGDSIEGFALGDTPKLARFGDELVAFDRGTKRAYTWSRDLQEWASIGSHYPIRLSEDTVDGPTMTTTSAADPLGGYTEVVDGWTGVVDYNSYYVIWHGVNYYVVEKSTLTKIHEGIIGTLAAGSGALPLPSTTSDVQTPCRIFGVPGTDQIVSVYVAQGFNEIRLAIMDGTDFNSGFAAPITLVTDADDASGSIVSMDAALITEGPEPFVLLTYRSDDPSNPGKTAVFKLDGTQQGATVSNENDAERVAVTYIDNAGLSANIWVAYMSLTVAGAPVRVQVLNFVYPFPTPSLVQITAPFNILTGLAVPAGQTAATTLYPTSVTTCAFLVAHNTATTPITDFPSQDVWQGVCSQFGVVGGFPAGLTRLGSNFDISSPIFLGPDNITYFFGHIGDSNHAQNTYFLMRYNGSSTPTVAARVLVGRAKNKALGFFANVIVDSTDETVAVVLPKSMGSYPSNAADGVSFGAAAVVVDFQASGNTVEIGGSLYSADGHLWVYDGKQLVEAGFHFYPEMSIAGTAAGVLPDPDASQTYRFAACYVWRDRNGNIVRSAPSAVKEQTIIGPGSGQSVSLVVPLPLTSKPFDVSAPRPTFGGLQVEFYRSARNSLPEGMYLEASVIADDSFTTVGYTYGNATNGLDDTQIVGQPRLYTDSGELEHIAPPAVIYAAIHGNRMWIVTDDNTIEFSKTWRDGFGVEFNDSQRIYVDPKGGRVAALASVGEQLLIGKEERLLRLYGDGPNDLGFGVFSEPLLLTSDIGVSFDTPMLEWQHGVVFQGSKGIWNVNRDFSQVNIGDRLKDGLESLPILNAVVPPNREEFWLIVQDTSSSAILVYDHHADTWVYRRLPFNLFGTDGPAAFLDNNLVVAEATGFPRFWREDDTYTSETRIKTGFFRPGGITGFHRMWWIYIHMKWLGPHTINVRLTYEDGATEDFSKEFLRADEPQIVRIKPSRQKDTAYQVEVWDSDFTENCCEWYGMTFVAGVKPQRLPVARGKNIGSE